MASKHIQSCVERLQFLKGEVFFRATSVNKQKCAKIITESFSEYSLFLPLVHYRKSPAPKHTPLVESELARRASHDARVFLVT